MDTATLRAFRNELIQISAARQGGSFDKVAAARFESWWDSLDPMEKQAFIGKLRKGARKAWDFAAKKPKVVKDAAGETIGEIPMGGGGGLLSGTGESLRSSGRSLRRAPKRSVRGEKFSREQLTAAGLPADPGMAQRVGGHAMEGAGKHIKHTSTAGLMINPIGVPLGGAVEGATKQLGIEARRGGATRLGRGAYRHAGKVGLAAEIGGLAGLGTAAGVPVSAVGAAGGKMVGLSAGLEHGLHAAGDVVHHGVSDVAGTAAKKYLGKGIMGAARRGAEAFAG